MGYQVRQVCSKISEAKEMTAEQKVRDEKRKCFVKFFDNMTDINVNELINIPDVSGFHDRVVQIPNVNQNEVFLLNLFVHRWRVMREAEITIAYILYHLLPQAGIDERTAIVSYFQEMAHKTMEMHTNGLFLRTHIPRFTKVYSMDARGRALPETIKHDCDVMLTAANNVKIALESPDLKLLAGLHMQTLTAK